MKLSKEAKVGLVVTTAIAALVWGINFLKGSELFSRSKKLYAVYADIDGLVTSNRVILNGYKVGQVQKLKFLDDHSGRILATLQVRRDVFVPKNSLARIVSSDLLGGKAVEIILSPQTDETVNGDTLVSDLSSGIAQQFGPVKDKAENLIQSLDTVATALHLLLDENGRKNLTSSFASLSQVMINLEQASRSLDQMLALRTGSVRNTADHMESITDNLQQQNEQIAGTIRNLSAVSDSLAGAGLATTVRNLDATLTSLDQLLKGINDGKGTLGKMATDDSLYHHLSASAADLDRLLVDLKANPKRYVQFSIFGKKSK